MATERKPGNPHAAANASWESILVGFGIPSLPPSPPRQAVPSVPPARPSFVTLPPDAPAPLRAEPAPIAASVPAARPLVHSLAPTAYDAEPSETERAGHPSARPPSRAMGGRDGVGSTMLFGGLAAAALACAALWSHADKGRPLAAAAGSASEALAPPAVVATPSLGPIREAQTAAPSPRPVPVPFRVLVREEEAAPPMARSGRVVSKGDKARQLFENDPVVRYNGPGSDSRRPGPARKAVAAPAPAPVEPPAPEPAVPAPSYETTVVGDFAGKI